MKSFLSYLIEKSMSSAEAMQILGLQPGFTADDLKKAYRAASIANHPDRGGDLAKMQNVNVANDVLTKLVAAGYTGTSAGSSASREYQNERRMQYDGIALQVIQRNFDEHKFTKHFEDVFRESFTVTGGDGAVTGMSVQSKVSWKNGAGNIVLQMSIYVDFSSLYRPSLAAAESGLQMGIDTKILANRRDVKLTQRRYTWSDDPTYLNNPDKLFPKAKLSAQVQKNAARKLSKRDVVITLEKEFGGKVDTYSGDLWANIPVSENLRVSLYRSTLLGKAAWTFQGVYEKKSMKKAAEVPMNYFYEDEASMGWIYDFFKHTQKIPPATAAELATLISQVCKMYKDSRKA